MVIVLLQLSFLAVILVFPFLLLSLAVGERTVQPVLV